MADAKAAESTEAAPKKKSKKLMFIIIGVVVLALIAAGGAFVIMKKKAAAAAEDGDDGTHKEETSKKKKGGKDAPPPVFIKLEAFTVKLQSEGQESYLQATPELRVLDVKVGEQIKAFMPEIRHKTLLILAGKKSSELTTPQGVERLSDEMRVTINGVLDPSTLKPKKKKTKDKDNEKAEEAAPAKIDPAEPEDSVQAVLFTSFIVQ